jgi:hypothetical protein
LAVGLNGAYGCDSSAETSGGGAGGSIWITASNLTGSGAIAANGGYAPGASHTGGGGGGGRIAIYYTTNIFTGTLNALGNYGSQYGGAGTIYTKAASQMWGQLTLNNGGNAGAATVLPGNETFDNLLVQGQAQLVVPTNEVLTVASATLSLQGNYGLVLAGQLRSGTTGDGNFTLAEIGSGGTLAMQPGGQINCDQLQVDAQGLLLANEAVTMPALHVMTNGVVSYSSSQSNLNLTVSGNLTVDLGGTVTVSGLGYGGGTGPGAGQSLGGNGQAGGGGGYGGYGGSSTGAGGGSYGSLTGPTDWGSGGGNVCSASGGRGGGAMQLTVGGTLTVNGQILAVGLNGAYGCDSSAETSGGGK